LAKDIEALMSEPDYVVTSASEMAEGDLAQVYAGLLAYNELHAGPAGFKKVRILVHDASGAVKGGLIGRHAWGWLQVDILWVAEPLRGKGWGSRILAQAEAEAIEAGCSHALLDTFEFQAPVFYEKQGYRNYAVLDDCPPGYRRYYLHKELRR
jgi:GNAT superfamily N-acetyltransferase